jgi:hypothetical protein
LQAAAARSVLDGGVAREVHTALVHVPVGEEPGLATLESALAARLAAGNARSKLKDAVRAKKLAKARDESLVAQGLAAGIIDQRDAGLVLEAARLADLAIAVDDHDPVEYRKARG